MKVRPRIHLTAAAALGALAAKAAIAALATLMALWGCAPVKQHQKEYLADPMMIPGSDAVEGELDAHNTGNREGTMTRGGAGGGGCGC